MEEPCGRCGGVSADGRNWKFSGRLPECDDCYFSTEPAPQPRDRAGTGEERRQMALALETN